MCVYVCIGGTGGAKAEFNLLFRVITELYGLQGDTALIYIHMKFTQFQKSLH